MYMYAQKVGNFRAMLDNHTAVDDIHEGRKTNGYIEILSLISQAWIHVVTRYGHTKRSPGGVGCRTRFGVSSLGYGSPTPLRTGIVHVVTACSMKCQNFCFPLAPRIFVPGRIVCHSDLITVIKDCATDMITITTQRPVCILVSVTMTFLQIFRFPVGFRIKTCPSNPKGGGENVWLHVLKAQGAPHAFPFLICLKIDSMKVCLIPAWFEIKRARINPSSNQGHRSQRVIIDDDQDLRGLPMT